MKYAIGAVIFLILVVVGVSVFQPTSEWPGVDESVIKKAAAEANRPVGEGIINIKGDVLLFAFLTAGAVGGFIAGYTFRGLFPPSPERT